MPSTIFNSWVKNVNNLFIYNGLISDQTSTNPNISNLTTTILFINNLFIQLITQLVTTSFYTYKTKFFNLLNKSFNQFPQHLLLRQENEN